MKVIPLFKSHHSTGRSILTLETPKEKSEDSIVEPDSIIEICKDAGLGEVVLVEDSMGGFMQAFTECKKAGLKLVYGARLTFCNDVTDDSKESKDSHHKGVVFARNTAGYQRLIKITTAAKVDFSFGGMGRIDYKEAAKLWSDDLVLAVPFYDSFLYKNHLTCNTCVPSFSFTTPTFFLEDNGLPFDAILRDKVVAFAAQGDFPTQEAQTIYYKNNRDFKAWQTFKCMKKHRGRGRTLEKPELEHCCSDSFSFENWKRRNDN